MNSHFEIIKEEYNPETYESIVEIHTHYGNFIGTTVADELDQEYPSQFQGNAIALAKALRKFAKAVVRQLKAEVKIADRMLSTWGWGAPKRDEEHYPIYLEQYRYYRNKCTELGLWEQRVRNLDESIINRIRARECILKTYREKNLQDKKG